MPLAYRIFGAEVSPYSIKVRSYFRYKDIPHEWIVRDATQMEEFQKYAKLPLIPCVVDPDDQAMQDSTPIIEKVEAKHPEPSIHPDDPALAVDIPRAPSLCASQWAYSSRGCRFSRYPRSNLAALLGRLTFRAISGVARSDEPSSSRQVDGIKRDHQSLTRRSPIATAPH